MTRLGFTGTMKGLTQEQRRRALEIIRDAEEVQKGENIITHLSKGKLKSKINKIEKHKQK